MLKVSRVGGDLPYRAKTRPVLIGAGVGCVLGVGVGCVLRGWCGLCPRGLVWVVSSGTGVGMACFLSFFLTWVPKLP